MEKFYILYSLQLLAYIIVFFIQRNQIKSVKEKFDAIDAYFKIFKIDEVNKYVELSKEKAELVAFAQIKREYQDHEAEFGRKYNQMFTFLMDSLRVSSKEEIELVLNTALFLTKDEFIEKGIFLGKNTDV